jgi:hypothetical protein
MNDTLGPALDPALMKALAKVAEEYLGAGHVVTKALGAMLTSTDAKLFEMARAVFDQLPAGQQNMIWLAAKSRQASTKKTRIAVKKRDLPYTAADLSPNRVLH